MRLLRINDTNVDIDDKTAFGITLQSYDIKEMAKSFVNVSNTFSIPKTSKNLTIFGNAQDPQAQSTLIYDLATCNYWIDNEQFLKDAKVKVTEINDRINLFIYQKETIWDLMKTFYWADLGSELLTWLQTEKGYPSFSMPYAGNFPSFISQYNNTTEGLNLMMFYSNMYQEAQEDFSKIYLGNQQTYIKGGHFTVYLKTIFEFLEYKYSVNFLNSGLGLVGNIWNDSVVNKIQIPIRDITINKGTADTYWFDFFETQFVAPFIPYNFYPFEQQRDKEEKTASDLVNVFMQHFNLIKDEFYINGIYTIRFARFDDLETIDTIEDWSGRIKSIKTFKPTIEGFAQNNLINFAKTYPEGSNLVNSKTLTVENKNIDVNSNLIEIDAYVPGIIDILGDDILDLSIKESFPTFIFLIATANLTPRDLYFYDSTGTLQSVGLNLYVASLYSLDDEYNFFDATITYPKYYEIEKYLTLADIKGFEFFKQYYIRELNGSFFVNKIKGFNPEKTKQATTIELLKVSNRTPISLEDLDVWVDGVQDIWVDGAGNYFN